MATILRPRVSRALKESCDLCFGGYYAASVAMAKLAVDHSMSDLALAIRPDLKRFFAGKRLQGFLRSEGAIDGSFAGELTRFASDAYSQMNEPTGRKDHVVLLIRRAAELRRRLKAIQRSL